jgi:hypothetical protein
LLHQFQIFFRNWNNLFQLQGNLRAELGLQNKVKDTTIGPSMAAFRNFLMGWGQNKFFVLSLEVVKTPKGLKNIENDTKSGKKCQLKKNGGGPLFGHHMVNFLNRFVTCIHNIGLMLLMNDHYDWQIKSLNCKKN